ncbi:PEP-CTERM sorting domain-containing protein [Nitrosomonas oligotropha]|uniref:PEP-CTERM sorting domain-containing protein n=1 Tax=Nitrosomonas oligotropha TaxID=42354 RepID=UPI00136B877D|nr:PEP-CTERM sorting domain-containing protein [Nitrosomonas oligotropha]MXS81769.1 PEP-CTERM sorting domain-containing protein [Nitrosomonas oligotropha]
MSNNNLSRLKYIAVLFTGILAASIPATASAEWSIMGLGTLAGTYSVAQAINDSGQVVGNGNGVDRAFITGANGVGMSYLDTLGGGRSFASDINNAGQVVGYSFTDTGDLHAFITGPNGAGMSDLGTLGGDYSIAYGVNNFGQVVGVSSTAGNAAYHAFITGPNGVGMTDLGTLSGDYSTAYSINDSGQVTGISSISDVPVQHAFITGANGVGMTDLTTLNGGTDNISIGRAINNLGQVVGFSGFYDDFIGYQSVQAFITDAGGINISGLGTSIYSRADAVNDIGQVVGGINSYCDYCIRSAFLYSEGTITDLSLLAPVVAAGWSELSAVGINNRGQIIGWGHLEGAPGGGSRAFLLSPIVAVPEPATYAMLLAGLGLLGFMLRRGQQTI